MQLIKFGCSELSPFGLIFVFIFHLIKDAARELDNTLHSFTENNLLDPTPMHAFLNILSYTVSL
jgi:hypothetical protein